VTSPDLVILAGANGVGKTTFARANLTDYIDQQAFLNADDIARDVNPSDVESVALEAGREMLSRRRTRLEQRLPFCIETTLATRTLCDSLSKRGMSAIEPSSSSCLRRLLTSTNYASSSA
jgi:predicted ABC-type ATPase